MISYAEALKILREQGGKRLLATESVALADIAGRICAHAITAPVANQPFDNSSRDGFALRAEDLAHAANDNPVTLPLAATVAAGDVPLAASSGGRCYGIMTGAPLPKGCDAIVPVEEIERTAQGIIFRASVKKGNFIRRAGADFAAGDRVLDKGTRLRTPHVLALATLGIGSVEVLRRPRGAVLSTGAETVDDLSAKLEAGQIYNSTLPYLRAALPDFGIDLALSASTGDDPAFYKEKLLQAIDEGCDIILSTGAVSAGEHDFVPAVLKELGAEIMFHKTAVRPGKPGLFARLPNGGPFFFGLPGNPASTAVGLRFFVNPLLRTMQGLPPEEPRRATLKNAFYKGNSGLYFFLRATTDGINADIAQDQQSFMVSPFLNTNAWAVVPEDIETMHAGAMIDLYTANGDEWLA